ncbi:MAG TPA: hypothetical protein VNN07_16650 [Candidatus Tectomicrobia bacterium]|nr:hypothetical protein [Candidatus Tectomicrobia bacterium]
MICRREIKPGDSVVFTEKGIAHAKCYVDGRRCPDARAARA